MQNKQNKFLQGMEHLKSEVSDPSIDNSVDQSQSHKVIRSELIQISIIMLLLFGTIITIILINNKTEFLSEMAVAIDNWI